jgi:hypothetical protein
MIQFRKRGLKEFTILLMWRVILQGIIKSFSPLLLFLRKPLPNISLNKKKKKKNQTSVDQRSHLFFLYVVAIIDKIGIVLYLCDVTK